MMEYHACYSPRKDRLFLEGVDPDILFDAIGAVDHWGVVTVALVVAEINPFLAVIPDGQR